MMATGYKGAVDRLEILVKWKPIARKLKRLAQRSPREAKQHMAAAVGGWHADAIRAIPVAASRRATGGKAMGPGLVRIVGRGNLKRRTRPFTTLAGGNLRGGLISAVPYAIWLAAGTRRIAKGRVMRWRHGQPPIRTWPAKTRGGNPRAVLPILLPFQLEARRQFMLRLRRGFGWL